MSLALDWITAIPIVNSIVGAIVAIVGSVFLLVGYSFGLVVIVIALVFLLSPFYLLRYLLSLYINRHSVDSNTNNDDAAKANAVKASAKRKLSRWISQRR